MEMKRDDPRIRDLDLVQFETKEYAITLKDKLSKLPEKHFLQCSLLCRVDDIDYLAMEKSYIFPSPAPKHLQLNAIGHILLMAVQLDLMGILHANLQRTGIVAVNNLPKLNCLPATLPNLDSYRTMFHTQQEQICELVDYIVGDAELTNPLYVNFRDHLSKCKDLVDYQSMYKHPYMTDPVDLPFYHIDCSLVWTCNIIKRRQFNDMFNHFTWISKVEEDGHPYIVDMLTSRTSSNGEVIEYRDTPFDKHVFIHNTMKHVNAPLSIRFWSVEAIHEQLQLLFPDYVLHMFTFMHIHGLNSHFGPEHYALKFLEYITNIDESGDGCLCIPRLVEALRFMYYLLAKFYWLCKSRASDVEVREIATSLVTCIRILQTVKERYYECDFSNKRRRDLSEIEDAIFSSIRLIYGAALFAYGVIKGIQTKQNITNALRDTSERFQRFSIIALFKQRDRVRLSQIRWPGVEDVMKILGVNFILMKNDWQVSYLEELEKVSEGLVQMLKI